METDEEGIEWNDCTTIDDLLSTWREIEETVERTSSPDIYGSYDSCRSSFQIPGQSSLLVDSVSFPRDVMEMYKRKEFKDYTFAGILGPSGLVWTSFGPRLYIWSVLSSPHRSDPANVDGYEPDASVVCLDNPIVSVFYLSGNTESFRILVNTVVDIVIFEVVSKQSSPPAYSQFIILSTPYLYRHSGLLFRTCTSLLNETCCILLTAQGDPYLCSLEDGTLELSFVNLNGWTGLLPEFFQMRKRKTLLSVCCLRSWSCFLGCGSDGNLLLLDYQEKNRSISIRESFSATLNSEFIHLHPVDKDFVICGVRKGGHRDFFQLDASGSVRILENFVPYIPTCVDQTPLVCTASEHMFVWVSKNEANLAVKRAGQFLCPLSNPLHSTSSLETIWEGKSEFLPLDASIVSSEYFCDPALNSSPFDTAFFTGSKSLVLVLSENGVFRIRCPSVSEEFVRILATRDINLLKSRFLDSATLLDTLLCLLQHQHGYESSLHELHLYESSSNFPDIPCPVVNYQSILDDIIDEFFYEEDFVLFHSLMTRFIRGIPFASFSSTSSFVQSLSKTLSCLKNWRSTCNTWISMLYTQESHLPPTFLHKRTHIRDPFHLYEYSDYWIQSLDFLQRLCENSSTRFTSQANEGEDSASVVLSHLSALHSLKSMSEWLGVPVDVHEANISYFIPVTVTSICDLLYTSGFCFLRHFADDNGIAIPLTFDDPPSKVFPSDELLHVNELEAFESFRQAKDLVNYSDPITGVRNYRFEHFASPLDPRDKKILEMLIFLDASICIVPTLLEALRSLSIELAVNLSRDGLRQFSLLADLFHPEFAQSMFEFAFLRKGLSMSGPGSATDILHFLFSVYTPSNVLQAWTETNYLDPSDSLSGLIVEKQVRCQLFPVYCWLVGRFQTCAEYFLKLSLEDWIDESSDVSLEVHSSLLTRSLLSFCMCSPSNVDRIQCLELLRNASAFDYLMKNILSEPYTVSYLRWKSIMAENFLEKYARQRALNSYSLYLPLFLFAFLVSNSCVVMNEFSNSLQESYFHSDLCDEFIRLFNAVYNDSDLLSQMEHEYQNFFKNIREYVDFEEMTSVMSSCGIFDFTSLNKDRRVRVLLPHLLAMKGYDVELVDHIWRFLSSTILNAEIRFHIVYDLMKLTVDTARKNGSSIMLFSKEFLVKCRLFNESLFSICESGYLIKGYSNEIVKLLDDIMVYLRPLLPADGHNDIFELLREKRNIIADIN